MERHIDTSLTRLGYWVLPGEALMRMLRSVEAGADPEVVYVEEYANCESHETVDPDA